MRNTFIIFVFYFLGNFMLNHGIEIPEHLKAHAEKLHKICQKEIGLDDALVEQSRSGNLPNDNKFQCYVHCLFEKIGLIDENNIIHLEHLCEILPEELHGIVENLVSSCGTKHGADGCETAYLTVKCYFEADPELQSMLV